MFILVSTEFPDWLLSELDERNWSQAELARRARVSRTAISNVINQQRQPGAELCNAIASAFGYPPSVVFRAAWILPQQTDVDEETVQMMHLFEQLTEEDQEAVMGLAQFLLNRRSSPAKGRTRPAEG